jgi:ribonuclease HI
VVPEGPYASGAEAATTNQRMELTAALSAVEALDGPLEVRSDSTYLVNCFRDRWWEGWLRRGWLNSGRKPVANRDLWEPLVEHVRKRSIRFVWVKGHSSDRWNNLADRLAVEAAASQRPRSGERPPDRVASPPPTANLPADREIDGHVLLVTGHRPPALGGYGKTEKMERLLVRMRAVIAAKHSMHPDLVVLTGLNLGTETLAAEAAGEAQVPYVVVLAYANFDRAWPDYARRRFAALLAGASQTITLQRKGPETKAAVASSMARRDAFMRRNADEALVVWDGEDRLVAGVVGSLQRDLGEALVWLIDPLEV